MKTAPIIALVLGFSLSAPPGGARALELAAPVARQVYTCEGNGLSRVAAAAQPAPCCTGQLGCPQLLANTGLEKPKRLNRT